MTDSLIIDTSFKVHLHRSYSLFAIKEATCQHVVSRRHREPFSRYLGSAFLSSSSLIINEPSIIDVGPSAIVKSFLTPFWKVASSHLWKRDAINIGDRDKRRPLSLILSIGLPIHICSPSDSSAQYLLCITNTLHSRCAQNMPPQHPAFNLVLLNHLTSLNWWLVHLPLPSPSSTTWATIIRAVLSVQSATGKANMPPIVLWRYRMEKPVCYSAILFTEFGLTRSWFSLSWPMSSLIIMQTAVMLRHLAKLLVVYHKVHTIPNNKI